MSIRHIVVRRVRLTQHSCNDRTETRFTVDLSGGAPATLKKRFPINQRILFATKMFRFEAFIANRFGKHYA